MTKILFARSDEFFISTPQDSIVEALDSPIERDFKDHIHAEKDLLVLLHENYKESSPIHLCAFYDVDGHKAVIWNDADLFQDHFVMATNDFHEAMLEWAKSVMANAQCRDDEGLLKPYYPLIQFNKIEGAPEKIRVRPGCTQQYQSQVSNHRRRLDNARITVRTHMEELREAQKRLEEEERRLAEYTTFDPEEYMKTANLYHKVWTASDGIYGITKTIMATDSAGHYDPLSVPPHLFYLPYTDHRTSTHSIPYFLYGLVRTTGSRPTSHPHLIYHSMNTINRVCLYRIPCASGMVINMIQAAMETQDVGMLLDSAINFLRYYNSEDSAGRDGRTFFMSAGESLEQLNQHIDEEIASEIA